MKNLSSRMGFLFIGLTVAYLINKFGIQLDMIIIGILAAIGIAMIFYGLKPKKDWSIGNIGVSLPGGGKVLIDSWWKRFWEWFKNN